MFEGPVHMHSTSLPLQPATAFDGTLEPKHAQPASSVGMHVQSTCMRSPKYITSTHWNLSVSAQSAALCGRDGSTGQEIFVQEDAVECRHRHAHSGFEEASISNARQAAVLVEQRCMQCEDVVDA